MAGWLPLAARASLPAGSFSMDFKNGVYQVGSTLYTAAQTITQTALVTPGTGLVIPNRNASPPGIVEILGVFNTRLIAVNFTLIMTVTTFNAALNGISVIFNVQNDDLTSWFEMVTTYSSGGGTFDIMGQDSDGIIDNNVTTSGGTYNVGNHKVGVTCQDATQPLSLAIDGVLIGSAAPGPLASGTWTKSCFGGDYVGGSDSCRNGLTIESLTCQNAVAAGSLAALTA